MIVYFTIHDRMKSHPFKHYLRCTSFCGVDFVFKKGKEGAAKVMFERVTKITLPPYPQGYDSVLEYENICVGEFLDRHFV